MFFKECELKNFFTPIKKEDKVYSYQECVRHLYFGCGIKDVKTNYVYFLCNRNFLRIKPNLKHSIVKNVPLKSDKFVLVNTNEKLVHWVDFSELDEIVEGIRNYQIKYNTHKEKGYSKYCCFLCKKVLSDTEYKTKIDIINPEPIRMLSEIANAFSKHIKENQNG